MNTASHTMIARREGYDQERKGLRLIFLGVVALGLTMTASSILSAMAERDRVEIPR